MVVRIVLLDRFLGPKWSFIFFGGSKHKHSFPRRICAQHAPSLSKQNIFALTRLDQNRAIGQIAHHFELSVPWGIFCFAEPWAKSELLQWYCFVFSQGFWGVTRLVQELFWVIFGFGVGFDLIGFVWSSLNAPSYRSPMLPITNERPRCLGWFL